MESICECPGYLSSVPHAAPTPPGARQRKFPGSLARSAHKVPLAHRVPASHASPRRSCEMHVFAGLQNSPAGQFESKSQGDPCMATAQTPSRHVLRSGQSSPLLQPSPSFARLRWQVPIVPTPPSGFGRAPAQTSRPHCNSLPVHGSPRSHVRPLGRQVLTTASHTRSVRHCWWAVQNSPRPRLAAQVPPAQ